MTATTLDSESLRLQEELLDYRASKTHGRTP